MGATCLHVRCVLPHSSCRRIHTAAQDGNISGAESAFTSMAAAGLPPGPRAYHVLLCAYLKAGDVVGGLDVTRRATDAGEVGQLQQQWLRVSSTSSSSSTCTLQQQLSMAVQGIGTLAELCTVCNISCSSSSCSVFWLSLLWQWYLHQQ